MDNFRIYLPSNASTDLFPTNSPSNYTTALNHPLILNGDWEVGVESICYNSKIESNEESAIVDVTAYTMKVIPVTKVYKFQYKLPNNRKWNYNWIYINSEYDGTDHDTLCSELNKGNQQIIKTTDTINKIFNFRQIHRQKYKLKDKIPVGEDKNKAVKINTVVFYNNSFAMRITKKMALRLGFSNRIILNGTEYTPKGAYYSCDVKNTPTDVKLTKESYKIKIFDSNMIVCEEVITLKHENEAPYSLTDFVKRWNNTIGSKYNDLCEEKDGKLIINKTSEEYTYVFSYYLPFAIHIEGPLISEGIFIASDKYKNPYYIKKQAYRVFIYGNKIVDTREKINYKFKIVIQPRLFETVTEIIDLLNQNLKQELISKLGNHYNAIKHNVNFEINKQKTVLTLGSQIDLEFSENLKILFGFINASFVKDNSYISFESPLTLDSREQHLYIQSDIISPIQYGNQKEHILAYFIHTKRSTYGLMEKLFESILFQSVVKQFIPQISIKITNGLHHEIQAEDTKTLITLIFRRKN